MIYHFGTQVVPAIGKEKRLKPESEKETIAIDLSTAQHFYEKALGRESKA